MNRLAKLGLAAALVVGSAGAAIAQDLDVDAGVDVGIDGGTDAGMDLGVDVDTTGAIGADAYNYGTVVSDLRTGAGLSVDRTAFNADSEVRCVTVTSLQGNTDSAAALDQALVASEERIASFRADIASNSDFMSQVEASCAGIAEVSADNILSIRSGAGGEFIVYVDDRA